MTNTTLRLLALVLFCAGLLSGCATLTSDFDPPKVSVESFRTLPTNGSVPRFEIKLRVQNPNEQQLDIVGISYSIELLGQEVVSGVTNEVPVIEGYSEEVITLEAGLQLLQILRMLTSLGRAETDELEYLFLAKIDFAGFIPTQRVEESGQITLN